MQEARHRDKTGPRIRGVVQEQRRRIRLHGHCMHQQTLLKPLHPKMQLRQIPESNCSSAPGPPALQATALRYHHHQNPPPSHCINVSRHIFQLRVLPQRRTPFAKQRAEFRHIHGPTKEISHKMEP